MDTYDVYITLNVRVMVTVSAEDEEKAETIAYDTAQRLKIDVPPNDMESVHIEDIDVEVNETEVVDCV